MVYIKQKPLDRIEALRQEMLRGPFSVILSQPTLRAVGGFCRASEDGFDSLFYRLALQIVGLQVGYS